MGSSAITTNIKKFNITKEEFENYVMAPLSPIDDFNHYES